MNKLHAHLNNSSLASGIAVAAFAATFAAVAIGTSRRNRKKESDFEAQVKPILVPPTQIYTPNELEVQKRCWDERNPEGRFLKERHGYTHFVLDGLENGPSKKGLIVVIHGVGENSKNPKEFSDCIVHNGFAVLRYDFYGHGYSKYGGNDPWFKYTPDMLVDQLEDVLEYVLEETKERVVALVGHSTGGVVCIKANERWANNGAKRGVVSKIILLAPCLYADKPLIARIADLMPATFTACAKNVSIIRILAENAYVDAAKESFGRDPDTKEIIYPEAQCKEVLQIERVLAKQPFYLPSIFSINSYALRGDMLHSHRESFLSVLKRQNGQRAEILYLWGSLDTLVPFDKCHQEIQVLEHQYDNLTFSPLGYLGHKMFQEDSTALAGRVIPFINQ